MDEPASRGGESTRPPSAGSIRLCGSVERARYLEIEIAISRQLSYLRLIQDKAFLNTMVIIIITIYYYYSLQLNTLGAASAARGRIRLVWGSPSSARRGPNLSGGARARASAARALYIYYIYLLHRTSWAC